MGQEDAPAHRQPQAAPDFFRNRFTPTLALPLRGREWLKSAAGFAGVRLRPS